MAADIVIMGNIGAPYGIQGWVKVNSYAEPKQNIFDYPWLLNKAGDWQPVELEQFRAHAGGYVAKLADLKDRDQAALITNCKIGVDRNCLPELDDGQYYWADIIGLRVSNQDNVDLGKVVDIFATGANDVLVIKGEKEHLVPLVFDEYVLNVDLDTQSISVRWDPEL